MTGVIYARYSSENQREESIDGQLRECMAFAERNDITILGTYIDRAMSAKTDNRPEFQRMIKDSGKKMFDVILVWKLDRFSRNRYDSAHYKAILKKNNVKVISVTEAISQGAEGIILESVLEGMAEYYSAELAEKVNRGMMENALKCRYNGGTLPVGYKLDLDKRFEIDPLTAPVVLETFQHYLDGKTMKELAAELNAKGIKNKRGGVMNINSIARMLQNRHYIGEYSYKDIVTPSGVPTIVPQEIFDAVQEKLATNKKAPARHKAEDDYLLTTKLFCGKCESFMVGESGTSNTERKYRYYKCVKSKKRCGCDKKAVRKDWIEDIVMAQIKKIIFDDDAIEDITDIVMEVQSKENVTLPMLQKQLSDIERGIENMLNAIQDGIYTPSTKQRLTDLEERRDELSVMIAQEEIKKPLLSRKQVKFWFHRLRKLDTTKLEHKKRLINTFVNAVIVYDDGLKFVFNYKDGAKTVTFKELEESSDLFASARPKIKRAHRALFIFDLRGFEGRKRNDSGNRFFATGLRMKEARVWWNRTASDEMSNESRHSDQEKRQVSTETCRFQLYSPHGELYWLRQLYLLRKLYWASPSFKIENLPRKLCKKLLTSLLGNDIMQPCTENLAKGDLL